MKLPDLHDREHDEPTHADPFGFGHDPSPIESQPPSDPDFLQRRGEAPRKPPPTKFGAIDVGTNSIHLVMVEVSSEGDFRILGRDKELVQLGKGGFVRHLLTPTAIEAGVASLTRFTKMARLKGVSRLRAVATSAVREAKNGGDFVERVRHELGLELHVLSSEEEARLIYLAVKHAVNLGDRDNLIVDIGGGSVEIILGNSERPEMLFSAKLGALRLSEIYIPSDPPSMDEIKSMRRHILRHIEPLAKSMGHRDFARCICTSGTFQNIATVCAYRRGLTDVNGSSQLSVGRDDLKSLGSLMSRMSREQRLKVPGVEAKRVDNIVPAITTLLAIAREFDVDQFEYCDMALREGIIIDHIAGQRAHFRARAMWPDARMRSVVQLAERCGYNHLHANQVQRLALSLYDQLEPLHELDRHYRALLAYACLLHDIGYLISHSGHHKHSYYLIRNGGLQDFTDMEVEMIANLARYHRKSRPRKSDFSYSHLDKEHRRAFRFLLPLLRLANALDRTHYSVVDAVQCRLTEEKVELLVKTAKDSELEIWTAQRECPLFEKEYRVHIEVSLAPHEALESPA
ncbi:MAG: Ppx/GppA phosphatase family protein [Planctomycetota bacterium]